MDRFLNGSHDPVTHAWGFLNVEFLRACAFFDGWLAEIRKASGRDFEATIGDALAALGSKRQDRVLLCSTKSAWVAVFADRDDAYISEVAHPAHAIPCRAVNIQWVPHTYDRATKQGRFGGVGFQTLADHPTDWLNVERAIGVWADTPGWEFEQTGEPLPFEDVDQYRVRRVQSRFPPELLVKYCHAYGIDAFDPNFYGPNFRIYEPAKRSVVFA